MTAEEQIDFIRFLYEQWKAAKRELIVFDSAFNFIRNQSPQLETTLDKILESARKSEAVQKVLETQLEGFEALINNIGEGTLEKEVREFQEKFGSKHQIH